MRNAGPLQRLLGGNLNVVHVTRRRRNRSAVLTHPFKVKLNGLANRELSFFHSRACGHAAGQIRYVSGVVCAGVFNNDRVSHGQLPYFFRPDCFRILLSVPGAKSSLGLPGTVTRPAFVGCLNWRWLPRVATRYQPSALEHAQDLTNFHALRVPPRSGVTTRFPLPPNGEVEGPPRSAPWRRGRTISQRPRRQAAGASRTPPTIVRPLNRLHRALAL